MTNWLSNSQSQRGVSDWDLGLSVLTVLLTIGPGVIHWSGFTALAAAALAGMLCATGTGVAMLIIGDRYGEPRKAVIALWAGTIIRMGVPLTFGLALYFCVALLAEAGLMYYLLVFYPLTLAVGTALSLPASRQAASPARFPRTPAPERWNSIRPNLSSTSTTPRRSSCRLASSGAAEDFRPPDHEVHGVGACGGDFDGADFRAPGAAAGRRQPAEGPILEHVRGDRRVHPRRRGSSGDRASRRRSLLAVDPTLFFFILFCNLMGLVPCLGSPTASFSVTAPLALVTFLVGVGAGMKKYGLIGFWTGLCPPMDVPIVAEESSLVPMILVLEIVGLVIRYSVLAVRLLANMFGGHLGLAIIIGFIPAAAGSLLWYGVRRWRCSAPRPSACWSCSSRFCRRMFFRSWRHCSSAWPFINTRNQCRDRSSRSAVHVPVFSKETSLVNRLSKIAVLFVVLLRALASPALAGGRATARRRGCRPTSRRGWPRRRRRPTCGFWQAPRSARAWSRSAPATASARSARAPSKAWPGSPRWPATSKPPCSSRRP